MEPYFRPQSIKKGNVSKNKFTTFQTISCLSKLEALSKLQTLQMEGNPVWSCAEYSYYLVTFCLIFEN